MEISDFKIIKYPSDNNKEYRYIKMLYVFEDRYKFTISSKDNGKTYNAIIEYFCMCQQWKPITNNKRNSISECLLEFSEFNKLKI